MAANVSLAPAMRKSNARTATVLLQSRAFHDRFEEIKG